MVGVGTMLTMDAALGTYTGGREGMDGHRYLNEMHRCNDRKIRGTQQGTRLYEGSALLRSIEPIVTNRNRNGT